MPHDPITAYAVRTGTGIALKLDRASAEQYAAQHHGTLHRLVEWVEPVATLEEPRHSARTPNHSGLVRI